MKRFALVFTLSVIHCTASALQAEDATFNAGLDYTSNYVSSGVTQTRGKPTAQAFLEVASNGFYAGTWMSGVDFGDDDNLEVDLYLGYRTTFDSNFYLDLGYAHYFYDDSDDCCGEFKVTGAFPIYKELGIIGYVAYNPRSGDFNRSLTLAQSVNDRINLLGEYGKSDFYGHEYWRVGGSVALSEFISGSIFYHGAESGDEGLVFTLSVATDQSNFARLLTNPFGR